MGFIWPNTTTHFQVSHPPTSFTLSAEKKYFEGEIHLMLKTAKIRQIDCALTDYIFRFSLQAKLRGTSSDVPMYTENV